MVGSNCTEHYRPDCTVTVQVHGVTFNLKIASRYRDGAANGYAYGPGKPYLHAAGFTRLTAERLRPPP
jgi:hypothetical protein